MKQKTETKTRRFFMLKEMTRNKYLPRMLSKYNLDNPISLTSTMNFDSRRNWLIRTDKDGVEYAE